MHTIFESCFPLALGTAPFGTGIPRNTAFAILDAFVDAGGSLVDTAAVYGMGSCRRRYRPQVRGR